MKTTTNISYAAFALFALACFALSPQARAVCQEGCGSDVSNTFLGEDALLNNLGAWNTAVGFNALINNTTGGNTAFGFEALENNTTGVDNTSVGIEALSNNFRPLEPTCSRATPPATTTLRSKRALQQLQRRQQHRCRIRRACGQLHRRR